VVETTLNLLHRESIALLDWGSENRAGESKGRSDLGDGRHAGDVCKASTEKDMERRTASKTVGGPREKICWWVKNIQDAARDLALYQASQALPQARQTVAV
jgi:hypothetical protein